MSEEEGASSSFFSSAAWAPASLGSDSRVYVGSDSGYLVALDTFEDTQVFEFPKWVEGSDGPSKPVRTTRAIGEKRRKPEHPPKPSFSEQTTANAEPSRQTARNSGPTRSSATLNRRRHSDAMASRTSVQQAARCTHSLRTPTGLLARHGPSSSDNRNTGSLTTEDECAD